MNFWFLIATLVGTATASLTFDEKLIPKVDAALPIFSLKAPVQVPEDLFLSFVRASSPNLKLTEDSKNNLQLGYDRDILVSLVNRTSGATTIYPNLQELKPVKDIDVGLAQKYIKDPNMFPRDDTKFSIVIGSRLLGTNQRKGEKPTSPLAYLAHASVQRKISAGGRDIPVCGPGSRASFGFGADGQVHSLSYQWNPAALASDRVKPIPAEQIYKSISKQLSSYAESRAVKVDAVDLCFYDSGLKYMQPVYQFRATLNADQLPGINKTAPSHILGYISVGKTALEDIPSLSSPRKGVDPGNPFQSPKPQNSASPGRRRSLTERAIGSTVNIGRYVVRDDSGGFVQNARDFWGGLGGPGGLWFLSPVATFVDKQFYWSKPFLFTSDKDSFINQVHVAHVEAHGAVHLFTTEKSCCDTVSLADIPSTGYGGGAGGILAYWTIHTCSFIPTTDDFSAADSNLAWDPWWPVFNGIHAVTGARTHTYIQDDVMEKFGIALSLGASYVGAWLGAMYVTYHDRGDPTYFDDAVKKTQPLGRASAVFVTGHVNDNVLQLGNLGRPGQLSMMWYAN